MENIFASTHRSCFMAHAQWMQTLSMMPCGRRHSS